MPCIVAFIVLGVMGLFSSTHRALAKEAMACMTRRVTLRPCDTGFNQKVQGKLVGWLMRRSTRVARFVNRYFELLAWVLFAVTLWSLVVAVDGLYNFYFYGSCEGLNDSSFCVLDPAGNNSAVSNIDVSDEALVPKCSGGADVSGGLLSHVPLTLKNYPRTETDSQNEVIFIGCFECPNTRATYPTLKRLLEEHNPDYSFIHQPTKPGTAYMTGVVQCTYEASKDDEWRAIIDQFFASEPDQLAEQSYVYGLLAQEGYDSEIIRECANSDRIQDLVAAQRQEVLNTGIYGTPLIFANETPVVGPKPYRVYHFMME
jgi:hypothetical protein